MKNQGNSKVIKLSIDRVYGMIKMYPDNDTAKLLCKFAKVKSLTSTGVKCLMELGYSIETDKPGFDPLKVKGIVRKKKGTKSDGSGN